MRFSYPILRRLGLGAHLAVIIGLAAVPTAFLVIEFIKSQQREAIEDAEEWTRTAARYAAAEHRDDISDARELLQATAAQAVHAAQPAEGCVASHGAGHALWLIAGDDLRCGPDGNFPLDGGSRNAILERTPNEGFVVVGPLEAVGGDLHLFAVQTTRAHDGTLWRLVRSVDVTWRPILDDDIAAPSELVVMAFDQNGRIYHRDGANDPTGPEAELPHFDAIHSASPSFTSAEAKSVTVSDIDGTIRIFGIAPVPEADTAVVVGVSHDAVVTHARRDLIGSLALFASVIALSALLAWLIIERKVLRSIRNLRDAAVATANGEDGRKVEIVDGPVELRELADAFNEMTAKLQHQALHDQLTGLANRRLITQRMEWLQRKSKPFSVLAVDLDGFKPVNDTYGHVIGDFVLSEIAGRLSAALPSDVTIGRTGGDEFIALVPKNGEDENPNNRAIITAQVLLDQIRQPIDLDSGDQVKIGGCIGISSWPQGELTPEEVIRQADTELYRAKESGRNRYSVHDPRTGKTRAA